MVAGRAIELQVQMIVPGIRPDAQSFASWQATTLCAACLIAGSSNTHIATLVERRPRFTMLVKVQGKDTRPVVEALVRQIQTLPEPVRLSLTWDRGSELAGHERLSLETGMDIYFCDPGRPWQRGTNKNTNRLLRQYFPQKKPWRILAG